MSEKSRKLEMEKNKLSEKWIKLSTKNKTDDRQKSRIRDLECINDDKQKEFS